METNKNQILCLSCPASADYSIFFENLLLGAYQRSNGIGGEEKKERIKPYHFDTFVCNNETTTAKTNGGKKSTRHDTKIKERKSRTSNLKPLKTQMKYRINFIFF